LRDWYTRLEDTNPRFLSPLYYQGTDDRFHYFICRSMDTWVPVRVKREEITIADPRPLEPRALSNYYAVDPGNGFKKKQEQD